MAAILIMQNQYSTKPNTFTLRAFTKTRLPAKSRIQTQTGEVGNQYCM